jgi:hypothetical protein
LVTTDRGDQIVIDVKDWKASAENTARAIHQAQRYKELSKAAAALIVTAIAAPVFAPGAAVVPVSLLLAHLSQVTTGLTRTKRSRTSVTTRSSPNKKIFASMPFKDRYDDTFLVAIQPAALALNAVADRFDYAGKSGDIVQQIKEMIKAAQVVVADLSGSRPNVCHEVGYAEALSRPVVQICSSPFTSLPFNLRNNKTICYSIGQASRLKTRLEKELAKVL